jgi:predicted neutral ceramidase superfamily lipid hydrolase
MNSRPASRPAPTSLSHEALERKWQRVILLAMPFGILSTLLAIPLERLSGQWTPYDALYPVLFVGFIIAQIILAFRLGSLRTVILSLVSGAGLFFLGKLAYTLFFIPDALSAHKQIGESFYWIPG